MSNLLQSVPDSAIPACNATSGSRRIAGGHTPHSALASQPATSPRSGASGPLFGRQPNDGARLVEDILSSYEQRIDGVQSVFDATRLVLADFQESADQSREEQERIHRQLRDILARNENLRNKDYDLMIQRIVKSRCEQDREIRALLDEFLAEQQRLAVSLKECYNQIREQLAGGNTPKIRGLLMTIKELLAEQAQCKQELTANLREAQENQQATVRMVKQLLMKGNTLRIKDFKEMLAHIQSQGKARIARKFKRREEVRRMLAEFKQQRARPQSDACRTQRPAGNTVHSTAGRCGQVTMRSGDAEDRQAAQMPGAVQWAALSQLQILDRSADMQTKTA